MTTTAKAWLHGLGAATVGGVTTAVTNALGPSIAGAVGIKITPLDPKQLITFVLLNALLSAVGYLKQSPLPPADGTTSTASSNIALKLLLFGVLASGLLAGTACKGPTLQNGGYYAPGTFSYSTNATGEVTTNFSATAAADLQLYQADTSFYAAYTPLDLLLQFELNNRALLWGISPSIKHTLDGIRPDAATAVKSYLAARAAYVANPTPAGLSGLQTLIAKVNQLWSAGQAVQAQINAASPSAGQAIQTK